MKIELGSVPGVGWQPPKMVVLGQQCEGSLKELERSCDNSHEHTGWDVTTDGRAWHFATKEEAEYPNKQCKKVADLVEALAKERGVVCQRVAEEAPEAQEWE